MKDLVDRFIAHYGFHKNKLIYLYGGSDGNKRGAYDSSLTYFDKIVKQLSAAGWRVIPKYQMHEIDHKEKFLFFNSWLGGELPHLPELKINKENAKELIVSIKNAPLKKEVIKKDKSSERQNIPQWQATHFSDAFDNYYFWKYSEYKDGGEFVATVFR